MFGRLFKSGEQKTEDQQKIEESLAKTRQGFLGRVGTFFQANEITDDTWDELEELLIQADLGMATAEEVVGNLKARVRKDNIKRLSDAARP